VAEQLTASQGLSSVKSVIVSHGWWVKKKEIIKHQAQEDILAKINGRYSSTKEIIYQKILTSTIVNIYGYYRRGVDRWMDLLTTYTHHSELQVITALSVISTFCKSLQHPLSLFETSIIVSWQRLLTEKKIQLHALSLYLHSFSCRTQLNWLNYCPPGWRPFHTNLLVFSSPPDFQLTGSSQLSSL
jgi:hypothetical protein